MTVFGDVEIEPLAEHWDYPLLGKKFFSYNESLEHLRQRGFERHLYPAEAFVLLADSLEGKLADPALQRIVDNMLKVSPENTEWLSCAVERKGDVLIAYLDPIGLQWNDETNSYDVQGTLEYSDRKEFSIDASEQSYGWVELRKFSNDFVTYFYGKEFDALPEEMKQGDRRAKVHLPPEGRIYPGCRYEFSIWFDYFFYLGASRGGRPKFPTSSLGDRREKQLVPERRIIKEFPDGTKLIERELSSGLSLCEWEYPPGHKFVELLPEESAQNTVQTYTPPPIPSNKKHSLTDVIKDIGHDLALSIMKDGIYWAIRLGLGAAGIAYFYETCKNNN